jgi:hypothetical protein
MMGSVIAPRRTWRPVLLDQAQARTQVLERSVRRRLGTAWGLLFFNTLTYTGGTVLHIPTKVGKIMAQGSLPLAILILLTINPKLKIRPSVFLSVASLLILDSMVTATQVAKFGTTLRTFRLAEYLFALWLLTPWFGRADMLLAKYQLRALWCALISVLVGMMVAPGRAFSNGGRLSGVIWSLYPTQVAQYGAVTAGMLAVLWMGRKVSGRVALVGVTVAIAEVLLSHTRTALVGLVAGLIVAGLSLSNTRVRRFFTTVAVITAVAVVIAAGAITSWLARGQGTAGLLTLTGRTNFWAAVLNTPRTPFQEIFGFGISNASVNGLPIDSNWLAAYMQEGILGVVVCALMLLVLFAAILLKASGLARALALFLVTYVLLGSITEDAFSDVSTYLLHLTVAASLIPLPEQAATGDASRSPDSPDISR